MTAPIRAETPFHPLVQRWFTSRIGRPTQVQTEAWERISRGDHVLITAPTGSGKTLAAFLWALDRLMGEGGAVGETRVLYVSPLKALNNDVQKNLMAPLAQIRRLFEKDRVPFSEVRVATRSGDTPSHRRRQLIRRPPEILITTPESLHLMLSSHGGRSVLGRIRTVILDEIHAVVAEKRGTLLMSAVDRLVPLSGEFQRIALSATVNPVDVVARFVGGFQMAGDAKAPEYIPRRVVNIRSDRRRPPVIDVMVADAVATKAESSDVWKALADRISALLQRYRATIVFVNSRRLCEKLTFLINSNRPVPVAYAHHGSLSKALRLEVEGRLKRGDLKAIVATSSLELGIDIGALDHVVLVQSPSSASSALQRIGRAGHGVDQTSTATLFPTHGIDCMNAAVLTRMVMDAEIEPVRPIQCPLDVLAQVLVAMAGTDQWDRDMMYHTVRTSSPFRALDRRAFDLVLEMLAGRYAASRISSLKPKIAIDRLDNTVTARKGALISLYLSGGVIPDRGYFGLRHADSGARIGELDEEFVWEAKKGQTFTLGTQNWRIQRITHNDVIVRPASPKAPAPPFWRAEGADRDFHLSQRIADFLERAEARLDDPRFTQWLTDRYHLNPEGARYLTDFLLRQRRRTGCALPHRHHLVVERMPSQDTGPGRHQVVLHTFWGGRVNRPLALALAAAWEHRFGSSPSVFPTNDAIYLLVSQETEAAEMMSLVTAGNVDALVKQRLEGSGRFGARFRECAARALLLPRRRFNQRTPLWLTRQNAKRLLDAVGRFADFPILMETWRSCLSDDFDLPALTRLLDERERGEIAWTEARTRSPSPMALSGSWRWINHHMYADDRQPGAVKTDLSRELFDEVMAHPQLRPAVDAGWVAEFEDKRHRTHPGYAPDSPLELLEWVKERLLIPPPEWDRLVDRAVADSGGSREALLAPLQSKLLRLVVASPERDHLSLIVAAEIAPVIAGTLYPDRTNLGWTSLDGVPTDAPRLRHSDEASHRPAAMDIVGQWLGYYGPVTVDFIRHNLALDRSILVSILSHLTETGAIVSGPLIRDSRQERCCDRENFETLLRMGRRRQRPVMEPLPIEALAPALAHFQGLTRPETSAQGMADRLQPLLGLPVPMALWETDILPARLSGYDPCWLDRLVQASALVWVGGPKQRVLFCHEDDLDLLHDHGEDGARSERATDEAAQAAMGLFADPRGRYTLADLLGDPPRPLHEVRDLLWAGVWAGRVTNDTMSVLREQMTKKETRTGASRWRIPTAMASMARTRSYRRRGRTGSVPQPAGHWRIVQRPPSPVGLVEKEELVKDRVRLLLDRYGILFRQLLARESPVLRWQAVFRALRLMELSGEVVAGCFFSDIPGPQFTSKTMLRQLSAPPDRASVFWLCAQDPASVCGLGLEALKGKLPRRMAGTHLVYVGRRLALVSEGKGKRVRIHLPADHARLADCFSVFNHLLARRIDPLPKITVETINGVRAADSAYLRFFRDRFDAVVESGTVTLYRCLETN